MHDRTVFPKVYFKKHQLHGLLTGISGEMRNIKINKNKQSGLLQSKLLKFANVNYDISDLMKYQIFSKGCEKSQIPGWHPGDSHLVGLVRG